MSFPPVPEPLKAIAHYLKIADEHDKRDIAVSYWCRIHALEVAIKLKCEKTPEVNKLLLSIVEWLEKTKSDNSELESITSKICGQATVENYALKLFTYADEQDRMENYGKNVVKAFYTSGILMDVLTCFGELSDDIIEKRKYAKWKAAYIHNCLKAGERPVPGPLTNETNDTNNDFTRVSDPPEPNINAFPDPPSSDSTKTDNDPFSNPSTSGWNVLPTVPQPNVPTSPVTPYPNPTPSPQPNPTPSPQTLGGFVPAPSSSTLSTTTATNLNPEQIAKAQKYCKFASSALNYDDIKTAIENLQKALQLLQFGKELDSPA